MFARPLSGVQTRAASLVSKYSSGDVMNRLRSAESSLALLASTSLFLLSGITPVASFADGTFIEFSDVTVAAGLQDNGVESWGAAWGDLNGDGHPDLFTSNHRVPGRLMKNNGDGTFSNASVAADPGKAILNTRDSHAGVWADFDNDGDQDLAIALGLESYLLINTNGVLRDERKLRGLTLGVTKESRMPVYFDLNNDGLLDIKLINWQESASLDTFFIQKMDHTFTKVTGSSGVRCLMGDWAQLADLNGSGPLELLCGDHSSFPAAAYDLATGGGVRLPITKVSLGIDAISGDFDGDLRPDFIVLRGVVRPNEVVRASANRLETHLRVDAKRQYTLTLATAGSLLMQLNATNWDVLQSYGGLKQVYIGATGYHPASGALALDPANPANAGVQSPNGRGGLFIGYNAAAQQWRLTSAAASAATYGYFVIDSDQPIGAFALSGLPYGSEAMTPVLMRGSASGLGEATNASGLSAERCVSGVAGDFDNDMDQDLFMACRGGAQNLANVVFENLGDGTFQKVGVSGAEGPVGPALSSGAGNSESVVTVDYDGDGFLDLLVTNGLNMRPKGWGGDNQLFRNSGNANGWLELDLIGASSNRDGVGAKVLVTSGGVTQYREQNGGYHRWSQNHKRIHVGLATNDYVDVTVTWPSGIVDTFANVAANAVYAIAEGQGIKAR
jgi:hypothetical protein